MQDLRCFQLPGITRCGCACSCCNMRRWQQMTRNTTCYQQCLLSRAYIWLYNNSAVNISAHCFDFLHTAHPHSFIHSAFCQVSWKLEFIWTEYFSKVPNTIKGEYVPTQLGHNDKVQSGQDPVEDDKHTGELPWDTLFRNTLVFQTFAIAIALHQAGLK